MSRTAIDSFGGIKNMTVSHTDKKDIESENRRPSNLRQSWLGAEKRYNRRKSNRDIEVNYVRIGKRNIYLRKSSVDCDTND